MASFPSARQRSGLGYPQLLRGRAFVAMDKREQLKFIAEKFKEMDSTELASIVRAIYGHRRDMEGRRKL